MKQFFSSVHKSFIIACSLILPLAVFAGVTDIARQGAEVTVISSDRNGIRLDVQLNNYLIKPASQAWDEDLISVTIPGEDNTPFPGRPELPQITRLVVIPAGSELSVEWTSETPRTVPAGQVAVHSAGELSVTSLASSHNGFYPEQVVTVDRPMEMRGVRLARVAVNPIQANAVDGTLKVYDRLSLNLKFVQSKGSAGTPIAHKKPLSDSQYKLLSNLVANPSDLPFTPPARDKVDQVKYRRGGYMYIAPDYEWVNPNNENDRKHINQSLAPLVDWRRRQGYEVKVVNVAENASNVAVKLAIIDAYLNWEYPPEHVCLIGDADLVQSAFMIPTWDIGRVYMWETDYPFALLTGPDDDLMPEVNIARISARNLEELERVISTKMIAYETTPDMSDTMWFRRAALMSNDQQTGYSSVYLQLWARALMMDHGILEVDTLFFIHGQNQAVEHAFIRDTFNKGISIFAYRGWGMFGGAWAVGDARELRNGSRLPIMIMPTCNTSDFADHVQNPYAYSEDFLWGREGGAIGSYGASGFTHTNYNNVITGGILNALVRDGIIELGAALTQGKIELYRHFGTFGDVEDPQLQNGMEVWKAIAYQINLIGDSGTELWTSVPRKITVTHDDNLRVGSNKFEVLVHDSATGLPVADAMVTLIAHDKLVRVGLTDNTGEVVFTFSADELVADDMYELSVTRHNHLPYLKDVQVVSENIFVGITEFLVDDDRAGRSSGNSDAVPNPGERIELRVALGNFGEDPAPGQITAKLECVVGQAVVVTDSILLDPPAIGDSEWGVFLVDIPTSIWHDERLVFVVSAKVGETVWKSGIEVITGAPDLVYTTHKFNPSPFSPSDTADIRITLENKGAVISKAMTGTLVSQSRVVNVFVERADFAPVDIEESSASATFRVYAHTQTVPGMEVPMVLYLAGADGFKDTTTFTITVGEKRNNTPFGPDAYGYVCFDDTDTDWPDLAPKYEWVELDTALGGPGVDTGIEDLGNEEDWTKLVPLPEGFVFQYYGEKFDRISVCSNGWFSFGDQSRLADFQNRRIPPALGPRAQVCVFWDDLVNLRRNPNDLNSKRIGGIFTWFDEENHKFYIQWSQMRRYIGFDDNNRLRVGSLETFQAVLYDPVHYPTYTGDGEFTFYYKEISDDPDVDVTEFDTPYATVGIINLDGSDGMEYVYWNRYANGAAPLVNHRAIKWTTKMIVVTGKTEGVVKDAATGLPIKGAEIRGSVGSFAIADADGNFSMDVLIGDSLQFTAWAPGYNELTTDSFYTMEEGKVIGLQFALTHPTFTLSEEKMSAGLAPDSSGTGELILTNNGNGPLTFRSYFDYAEGSAGKQWERLLNINVTELTNDQYIWGATVFKGRIWATGANRPDGPPAFYKFHLDGRYIGKVDQPDKSRWGFRSICADPENDRIFGGGDQWIVGVDVNALAVDTVKSPHKPPQALAYNSRDKEFWVGNGTGPLYRIKADGEVISMNNAHGFDIQGLAYYADDPDGYPLYIASKDKTHPALQVPFARIHKYNPETGDSRYVTVLEGELEDRVGGIDIVPTFDAKKWVMVAIMTNLDGDRISVYDMGPNTNWVRYEPRFGTLGAGESVPFEFTLNAKELPVGDYSILVRFVHNAAGLSAEIPVTLNVDPKHSVDDLSAVIPTELSLGQNYPNPFNPTTVIPVALPMSGNVRLTIYDLSGREVARLVDGNMVAGRHLVEFNATGLPSGLYLVKLDAEGRTLHNKMALIK